MDVQGLSLVALAGDPSPWRLPAAALDPLVKLMGDLVAGQTVQNTIRHTTLLSDTCLLRCLLFTTKSQWLLWPC